jgi:DNA-binding transcriptional regulator YiaG
MQSGVKIPDRQELIRQCGRSIACIHAVEYYIRNMLDPCHPPQERITTKARRYLMQLIEKYGAPRCDINRLVHDALRGSALEDLADDVVALAVKIKKELNLTSRVAAAVAAVVVAWRHRRHVSKGEVARRFGVSAASISEWKIRDALKI